MFDKVVVVVSPLLALMPDQNVHLAERASTRRSARLDSTLCVREEREVRSSCERPNLALEVVRTPSEDRRRAALHALLSWERGSGILTFSRARLPRRARTRRGAADARPRVDGRERWRC